MNQLSKSQWITGLPPHLQLTKYLKHWQAILPFCFIFLGLILFSSSGRDDSHITYWAAYSLSKLGEIVNYSGERVEQSSSLLHVLILALLDKLNLFSIPTLGRITSIVFGITSILAIYPLANRINPKIPYYTALILASSVYLIYWSYGGLETTLAALITILVVLHYSKYLSRESGNQFGWQTWGITACFILVRPENILVLAAFLTGIFTWASLGCFISRDPEQRNFYKTLLRQTAYLTLITAGVAFAIFTFRYFYFNSLMPQPVSVKSEGLSLEKAKSGIKYLKQHIFTFYMRPVMVLAGLGMIRLSMGLIRGSAINFIEILSGLFLLVYICFIVTSGGDWMEGGRFLVHILPLVVVIAVSTLAHLIGSHSVRLVVIGLVGLQLLGCLQFAHSDSTGVPIWNVFSYNGKLEEISKHYSFFEKSNRVHLRDIVTIGHFQEIVQKVKSQKSNKISIMSIQMGMVPFHISRENFGDIQLIDLRGLADRKFSECSITSQFPKYSTGLALSYSDYFENWQIIEQDCGIEQPDIIFDLFSPRDSRLKEIQENGYFVAYAQTGKISTGSRFLPGREINGGQFVAIKNDLADSLNLTETVSLSFEELQDK